MSNILIKCILLVYIFLNVNMRKYIQEVNIMANKEFTNKNIYDTVRINIRKYRKLKGMTQQELADASEFSHGYIREIESLAMKRYKFQTII